MKKRYIISLTPDEQALLSDIIEKRSSKSPQVKRAYILLASDINGEKQFIDKQISSTYNVRIKTIERLRKRFVIEGFEIALNGKKQEVFREKIIDGDVEAKLISLRCSDVPDGYNKWTLNLLADKMVELNYVEHISYESVRLVLKKTKLNLGV